MERSTDDVVLHSTVASYASAVLYESVFGALDGAGTRYVVVGGVAVVLHGHPRMTADLDLAIDLSDNQVAHALSALSDLGLAPLLPVPIEDFADRAKREAWGRDRNLKVFTLWQPDDPLLRVDLFAEDPVPFEQLWNRSVTMEVGQVTVHVASIPDLVEMKAAVGRTQDLADIEALQALHDSGQDRP